MGEPARSVQKLSRMYVDEALATGSLANIAIVVWRGEKTAERAATERRSLLSLTSEHPANTAAIFVIKTSAPPPNEAMRKASAEMVRLAQRDLRAVAVVVEGNGFTAAVARAVLTALERLTGNHSFPSRYFAEQRDAARWLLSEGAQATPDELVKAIHALESTPLDQVQLNARTA